MERYILYKELLERHVNLYEKEKIVVFLEDGSNYEILSNMNDRVNLTEIAWITNLRIGSKNMSNIHYISFDICDFDTVLKKLQENDYIIVILNSGYNRSGKIYNIHFPYDNNMIL